MPLETKHYFEFGPYRLEPSSGVLTRDGNVVVLNPKAVETLAVLVRHRGQVVSKEELMKAVWPDAFVEEANLNVQISALRKALEDRADDPAFVETIPRRGYRFRPEVREVYEEPAQSSVRRIAPTNGASVYAGAHEGVTDAHPQDAAALPAGRRLTRRALALCAVIVMAAIVAVNFWPRPSQRVSGAPSNRFLIGVLPFANLSGDAEQEYLADGLTEELITELARLNPGQLGVIGRTSMMPYKNGTKGLSQVAQELGLRYAMEGSVVRAGNRIRITVKLLQATDQSQLWANQYDRDFGDLIEVQRDVARSVARETFVHLTPEYQKRLEQARAVSPQAYDAYLKGRAYWWLRTEQGYERARAYFEEALRLDPNFARAYAGMADTAMVYGLRVGDPRPIARKAVALDDSLAEGHASLAMALWSMELQWTTAEAHFRRALDIDPYYLTARHWYGFVLAHWGRHAEAIEQLQRARDTDPLNLAILSDLGQTYFWAGQYDRAKEPLLKGIAVDPKFYWTHYWLGRVYEAEGRYEQALAEFELSEDAPFGRMDKNTALACLYAKMGRRDKAREIQRQLEKRERVLPANRALIHVALGETNLALKVLDEPGPKPPWTAMAARVEPGFAPLHNDPRYQAIIARYAPPAR